MIPLPERLRGHLLADEPLAKYTAARIGGAADLLYLARESLDQLAEVVYWGWQQGIPVRVIGGGANILVSDRGVRGLVVVNRVNQIEFGSWHGGRTVSASGGTSLSVFANRSVWLVWNGL
ncbi:MAG: FAD-binding protein [Chloroflexota bacterium]